MATWKEVQEKSGELQKKFGEEYFSVEPYATYIVGYGVGEDEKGLYLQVLLETSLPENLSLPEEFEGMRVKTLVVGKIELLEG